MAGGKGCRQPGRVQFPGLRQSDQYLVGGLVAASLLTMAAIWVVRGGHRGNLIDIDRAGTLRVEFRVDLNRATWPELSQLPGVGETLARRIVRSRQEEGSFGRTDDLLRVEGIGPGILDRIAPYLLTSEDAGSD